MKKFGLVGYPLSHSFSKKYFTEKFHELGLEDCQYENYELKDLSTFPRLLEDPELVGLNVTIPYKRHVVDYTNSLDDIASQTGVVNTLKIHRNAQRQISGHNTDAPGFRKALLPWLRGPVKEALILGTGATSRTTAWVLEQEGIACHFASRRPSEHAVSYEALGDLVDRCRLIVNTTPVGMYPHVAEYPAIPYERLTAHHLLFDFIYNPAVTGFLRKGQSVGATTQNGLNMLRFQADKAWEIWMESEAER